MGQRLNIEIKNNEKTLANCYYHWSGYTASSLGLTKQIIEAYKANDDIKADVQGAVALLRITGAHEMDSVSDDEEIWERTKDLFTAIDLPEYRWKLPFYCIDALIDGVNQAQENTRGRFSIKGCAYSSIY